MRKLALDFGERRIGLAISDETGRLARPLKVISHKNIQDDLKEIKKVIYEYQVDQIIVGLPLSTSGKDSKQALRVKEYIHELKRNLEVPVTEYDERFTTKVAQQIMNQIGLKSYKKKEIEDKISASIILQSFLDHGKKNV